MLSQTFELNLFDTTRTARLTTMLLVGIYTLLGICAWALVKIDNKALLLLTLAGVLGGGGYLGWRAYRRAAVVPALVTITLTQLSVEDLRPEPRLSQTLQLADIATYRYLNYNNTEELRLNPATSPPLKLRAAGALAQVGNFGGMLAAFEQAIGTLPTPMGLLSRREKSFFEKSVSTYLLVVFTLVGGWMGWLIFVVGKPVKGNMLMGLGSYLTYLAAWRAAAERRNAP